MNPRARGIVILGAEVEQRSQESPLPALKALVDIGSLGGTYPSGPVEEMKVGRREFEQALI